MKGKFTAYPNLMMIEQTLKEKQDYCLLTVSTTGIQDDDCPTRVCMQTYKYDEEIKGYKEGFAFDQLVKATPESVQRAYERAENGGYDVFANAGIDRESYIAGNSVLPPEAFESAFHSYMKSLDENTLMIANNTEHCEKFLDKVGCGKDIEAKEDEGKCLCQNSLTYEYFSKNDISLKKRSLEAVRDVISGQKEVENSPKIVGADNRLKVMNSFVTKYGRDIGVFEDERTAYLRQEDQNIRQSYSEKGKIKYQKSGYEEKINTLLTTGVVKEDEVTSRSASCELNKLLDALECKDGVKGVIFMQVATTGMGANDDPIQFTAMACKIEGGTFLPPKKNDFLSFDIQADEQSIAKAEQNMHSNNPFDAFAYTGIDYDTYKSGKSVDNTPLKKHDDVIPEINQFLKNHPDYVIVTSGTNSSNHMSYAQNAFSQNGYGQFALSPCQKQHIDFSQVVKEYCVRSLKTDIENALLKTDDFEGKKLDWQGIAQNRLKGEISSVDSTKEKVQLMILCIKDVLEQNKELNPKIYEELAKIEAEEKEKLEREKQQKLEEQRKKAELDKKPKSDITDGIEGIRRSWTPNKESKAPEINKKPDHGKRSRPMSSPFSGNEKPSGSTLPQGERMSTERTRRPLSDGWIRNGNDNDRILKAMEYQQSLNGHQLSIIDKQTEQFAELLKMQEESHNAIMQMSKAMMQTQGYLLTSLQQNHSIAEHQTEKPDYSDADVLFRALQSIAEQVTEMISATTNEEAKQQLSIISNYCGRAEAALKREKGLTQKEAS